MKSLNKFIKKQLLSFLDSKIWNLFAYSIVEVYSAFYMLPKHVTAMIPAWASHRNLSTFLSFKILTWLMDGLTYLFLSWKSGWPYKYIRITPDPRMGCSQGYGDTVIFGAHTKCLRNSRVWLTQFEVYRKYITILQHKCSTSVRKATSCEMKCVPMLIEIIPVTVNFFLKAPKGTPNEML